MFIFCVETAFLKHVTEGEIGGSIEVTGRRGKRCTQLLVALRNWKVLEIERGSTSSYCLENWLWKGLWTVRKKDCGINEWMREGISQSESASFCCKDNSAEKASARGWTPSV
jgi:hypothetical protein